MTGTTHPRDILLHKVPGDPVQCRLAAALKAAGPGPYLDLGGAARASGIDLDTAMAVLGIRAENTDWTHEDDLITFTHRLVPDGVRACYAGECPHGPGYVPEP